MPKSLYARTPQDTLEEQKVRKLANSRHAPADRIARARMIVLSRSALGTTQKSLPSWDAILRDPVRERIHRFGTPRG